MVQQDRDDVTIIFTTRLGEELQIKASDIAMIERDTDYFVDKVGMRHSYPTSMWVELVDGRRIEVKPGREPFGGPADLSALIEATKGACWG